jgi:membrane protease YdiL (CAAX protease family)
MFSMIAQFGPAVAALILTWYTSASIRSWFRSIVRWRVGLWWYAVAIGLPVVLIAVQGALFGLLGYPLDIASIRGRLVNFLPSAIILALIAGLGEEPLLALLTMVTIFFYAFFYTLVYNRTQSVLLCMLLHGSFNAAMGLLPASFEVLQRGTYVALLAVQGVTLLLAVAVLVLATGGKLGYDAASGRIHTV